MNIGGPDQRPSIEADDFSLATNEAKAAARNVVPLKGGWLGKIVGALFLAMIFTALVSVAIWPGQLKLLAPIFCTDAQPDAFVVTDSYQVTPGETTYNFTMYCMGPRGDVTAIEQWKPYAVLFGIHFVIALGLVSWLGNSGKRARTKMLAGRSRRSAQPPGSTAGPFVD